MRLVARFAENLQALAPGGGTALVAVSGGRDSVVLLDLLRRTRQLHDLDLVVAHVDHGIHPESGNIADRVETLAASFGLRMAVARLALGPGAGETEARAARYRWLRQTRRELGARWIITAHQADDQRETILMRMLRGSGPAGLAGMPARHRDILRPLLPFSRATLTRYAGRRGLSWWDDPANAEPRHLRSWIRTELFPVLLTRLPDLTTKLAETRRHALRERRAWDAAVESWPGLEFRRTRRRRSVSWPVLSSLPAPLAVVLTAALLRRSGGPAGSDRIRRALASLRHAPSGSTADVGQGWRLTRDFSRLAADPPGCPVVAPPARIERPVGAMTWGGWRVRWRTEPAPREHPRNGTTAWFIPEALALRSWRPGDRLAPLGARGHRLAVRCFQDARIPRSERGQWPMIEGQGSLAWIPGVCRSGLLLPPEGTPALRIDVESRG